MTLCHDVGHSVSVSELGELSDQIKLRRSNCCPINNICVPFSLRLDGMKK